MMNNIIQILHKTRRQSKSIVLIYLLQLVLGVFVAATSYSVFSRAADHTLELDRLAKGFDRSVFSDMVNEYSNIILSIQGNFILALLVFLFISIFLHAGLMGNIKKSQSSISDFLSNGKIFFLNFLGMAFFSLLISILILALIWIPFISIVGDPLESFHSEKPFIQTVIGLLMFSVLLISIVWLWSILSRYKMIEGSNLMSSMKQGWKQLWNGFFHYFMIAIFFIFLHVALVLLYTLILDDWGAETWASVIGLILIQQIFSILRVSIRASAYVALD